MSPNKYQGKNIANMRIALQNISLRNMRIFAFPFDRYSPIIRVKKKNTSYLNPRKADAFISKNGKYIKISELIINAVTVPSI